MKRINIVALWLALALVAAQTPAGAQSDSYRRVDGRDCAILDMPLDTARGYEVGYVFPSHTSAPGWEDLAVAELGAWARFGNWENESGGDFDLQALWDTAFLNTSGGQGDEAYPLTMARLRLMWTQRFDANYGFEIEASPGLYSTMDSFAGDDFAVPFGLRWIKPISPDVSVFAGANVYPTFDHVVDPRIGLRLAHRDSVVVDIGYPESSFTLKPNRRFRITGGARVALWPEFNMGEDTRERLRYQEIRLYGALELGITDYTLLVLNGGSVMQREITFQSAAEDISVDDALFAGVGLTRLL